MLNLSIHCGSKRVDREVVNNAVTPTGTRTWTPISHRHLLDQVEATLQGHGFDVADEAHALWQDGLRYFGLLEVVNGSSPKDYGLVLGLRNSHDKSFPASIGMGNGVFVCDNLCFFAEVALSRRHTRYIGRDLPQVVHRAIGRLTGLRQTQDRRIDVYKQTELDDRTAHDLIVRSIDSRVLAASQVPTVVQEWRAPRHEEFRDAGKTLWRLQNAFTEAMKGRSLVTLPRRSQALHGLLDAHCGLAL